MYGKAAAGSAGASGATLPATGTNAIWLFIAAFTLISAGFAIMRLLPRRNT